MRDRLASNPLLDRIACYRAEADRLLRTVQHPSMRKQIKLALRDLEEAVYSVNQPSFDGQFLLQQIADCAILNAIRRLALVDSAVRKHGPSVATCVGPSTPRATDRLQREYGHD